MMKVETLSIDKITPYVNNAKEHPDWQIDQIVKSIKQFGFNDPIAVDEAGVIIEGHGRYMAAVKMGMTEIPAIVLEHLSEQKKKAYILAHNKLTMNTGFDLGLLDAELASITDIDMGDFGLGFSESTVQEPKEIKINGYVKTHILISFPPDMFQKVSEHIEKIRTIAGVEVDQASN